MMTRTRMILVLSVAVVVVGVVVGSHRLRELMGLVDKANATRPNVVLIIIDALRADQLSCYWFPKDVSPEIDDLARGGLLFEDVIAQCSWTRPSIGSMISSLYPRTLGIYKERFDILPDGALTLAEVMKASGYGTLGITANPNINSAFNFHQGFDDYIDSRVVWEWMTPEPGMKHHDVAGNVHLPQSREIFDVVLSIVSPAPEKPMYVQINIMEVHSPYLVRGEFRDLVRRYPLRLGHKYYSNDEIRQRVLGTYAAVKQVSHDTAAFVNKISSLPGWKNTLFIITSDHGQGLVNHPDVPGSMHHGNLLYESQLRVPLILYSPEDTRHIPRGRRVRERVRLLDLMPTILDYLGIAVPQGAVGESLLPLISGKGPFPRLPSVFVAETNWREVDKIAAYGRHWKYIENRDEWGGVNKFELQQMGLVENGLLTDQIQNHGQIAEELKLALYDWEQSFPRAEPTSPVAEPTEEEVKQLKSLGYFK